MVKTIHKKLAFKSKFLEGWEIFRKSLLGTESASS